MKHPNMENERTIRPFSGDVTEVSSKCTSRFGDKLLPPKRFVLGGPESVGFTTLCCGLLNTFTALKWTLEDAL